MVFFTCWSGFPLESPGSRKSRPLIPGDPLMRLRPRDVEIVGRDAQDQAVLDRRVDRGRPDAKGQGDICGLRLDTAGHCSRKVRCPRYSRRPEPFCIGECVGGRLMRAGTFPPVLDSGMSSGQPSPAGCAGHQYSPWPLSHQVQRFNAPGCDPHWRWGPGMAL